MPEPLTSRTPGVAAGRRVIAAHPRLASLWPFALVTLLIALAFRDLLTGSAHIPYDIEFYHLPLLSSVEHALSAGQLPGWDPSTYGGSPFLANAQAAWIYPPHLIIDAVLAVTGADWTERLTDLLAFAHLWVLGLGGVALARARGLGDIAAVFSGTFLVLCGDTLGQTEHLGLIEMLAWIPWCLVVIERMQDAVTRRRIAALGVGFALIITAGFTPFLVPCVALLLVYGLLAMRANRQALGGVAGGLALGGGLSAAALMPLVAVLSVYPPLQERTSLPASWLLTAFVPNTFGHWASDLSSYTGGLSPTSSYLYVGAVGMVAIPLALASGRRVVPDALIAAVMVVLSFGTVGAKGADVIHHLPLMKDLYRPELVINVAAVPLTLALAHAFARPVSRRQLVALAAFVVAVAVLPMPNALGPDVRFLSDAPRRDVLLVVAAGLAALVAVGRPALARDRVGTTATAGFVLVGLVALALAASPRYFVLARDPATTADTTHTGDGSAVLTFLRGTVHPTERVISDSAHLPPPWNGFSPVWDLPNVNGFQPQFSKYLKDRVLGLAGPFDRVFPVTPALEPLFTELAIRYVIVSPGADSFAGRKGYAVVFEDAAYRVYRTPVPARRAYVTEPACAALPARRRLRCAKPPLATTVSDAHAGSARAFTLPPAGTERTLVTGEPYYPGWRAATGGRDLEVSRQGYLTAVKVPAGSTRVTMSYRPPLLRLGLLVSGLSGVLALVLLLGLERRRRDGADREASDSPGQAGD